MIIDTDKLWATINDHFAEEVKKVEAVSNCSDEQTIRQLTYLETQEEKEEQVIRDFESLAEYYLN